MSTISCSHGQGRIAPQKLIEDLQISQGGTGRHKCAICAYSYGLEDGRNGTLLAEFETCEHGSKAPTSTLSKLNESQAGIARHKCTNCAYHLGYLEGTGSEIIARESLQTELETHTISNNRDEPETEGQRRIRLHVTYERSWKNRAAAIALHGTVCTACGFDFDRFYGDDFARHYIEVHHVESITTLDGRIVNPEFDLVPLCSNCHSMAHRERGRILTVSEIKSLINAARQKRKRTP